MSTHRLQWILSACLALFVAAGCQQNSGGGDFVYIPGEAMDARPYTDRPMPSPSGELRFAIVADRTGNERPGVFEAAMDKINMLQPQFVMSVGDLIEGFNKDPNASRELILAQRKEVRGFIERLDRRFFFVPGNHDLGLPAEDEAWKRELGPSYYAMMWQGVLFLCLDSRDKFGYAGGMSDVQIAWAKKVLADHPNPRWTFVFLHHPLWPSEGDAGSGRSAKGGRNGFADIEQALGGRDYTVFAGHVHRYTSYKRNGHDYYVLGTTGAVSKLAGTQEGEFDHIAWVTLTDKGPKVANLLLSGILPDDVFTEGDSKLRWPQTEVAEQTDKPLRIAFDIVMDNLFDKPGAGKMTWTVPQGSPWKVTPASRPFTCPPKQVSKQRFVAEFNGDRRDMFPLPSAKLDMKIDGRPAIASDREFPRKAITDYLKRTRPALKVAKAAAAIVCDGNLDKAIWRRACDITDLTSMKYQQRPQVQAQAWLAYDDACLYLAMRCQEPNMAAVKTTATQRDGAVYADDSVELFIAPGGDRKTYYQFIVSAADVAMDSKGWDVTWNGEFSHAVKRDKDGWTVEIAIPWKTLGVAAPAPGSKMGVLIARTRPQSGEIGQWPSAPGGNHQPELFADAEFQSLSPGR